MKACALALFVLSAGAAAAVPPELAVFVNDADADVYVALYDDRAVELAGCGAVQARTLLHLDAATPVRETTLVALRDGFAFGTQPRLPCAGQPFDQDWAATTPIWADLDGSGAYYLPAATGGYVALPARCTSIKTALAIRERLQLPGVLQAMSAPPDLGEPVLQLDCGAAGPGTAPADPDAGPTGWSLHRFETFLTEASTGDTVLVARYAPPAEGAAPAYLPIWRIDGADVAPLALQVGGLSAAEATVKALLGIPSDAAVTTLDGSATAAVRSAPYADLCTRDCDGYTHAHAAFLQPGLDLGVSPLPAAPVSFALDRLGNDLLVWPFAEERLVRFAGCPALTAALGLPQAAATDWMAATAAAVAVDPQAGPAFDCRGGRATCLRHLPDGAVLKPADFAPGPDCAGAERLRIELSALVETTGPLSLTGLPFTAVTLAPAAGTARATLRMVPGRLPASSARCVLSETQALLAANGLPRLELDRIDVQLKAGAVTGDVLAFQIQDGTLALSATTLGGSAEGAAPLSRGINLCLADLYADGGRIEAETLAIQGLSARVLLSGTAADRIAVGRARFGLLLSAASQARLSLADVTGGTPIVLRGAALEGASVALAPLAATPPAGSGLQLERGATADLLTSSVTGFRCAVSTADAASVATFVLPGNDIAAANVNLACGAGQVRVME